MALHLGAEAKPCKPSGKVKVKGKGVPNCPDCCEKDKYYNTYTCSPKVSAQTKAVLTITSFDDDKGPSTCEGKFYPDDTPVVALSTGWFDKQKRCLKNVIIYGNGKNVTAKVVDECDSTMGCDDEHFYLPPCGKNILDASRGVWKALGVLKKDWGEMDIYWSDA
ncbi:hypothetical protein C2S51_001503 [Perilla frutescens var. frutescens]|nr:hypothetical protein C2S51_001503 [Perilla frutescens var. frutescens]